MILFCINKNLFFFLFSILVFIFSINNIIFKELNLGIEFSGGIEIKLIMNKQIKLNIIKDKLKNYKNIEVYRLGQNIVQIKIKKIKTEKMNIKSKIQNIFIEEIKKNKIVILNTDYIGKEIYNIIIFKSIISTCLSFLFMFIYLLCRFEFKFVISSIITLLHDIIIILGLIIYLKIEINLIIVMCLFTIFGYSINDTIVIFDRIRENKKKKNDKIKNIIKLSIIETLGRTLKTSITTVFVVLTLMFFTDKLLLYFSLIMFFGIFIGTYSSIFISSFLLIYFYK